MSDRKTLDGNTVALDKHLAEQEDEVCPWCEEGEEECECDPEYEQSKDDACSEDAHDARNER